MLVATRDPMDSPGAHDRLSRRRASRSTRFVSAMQIAGSVLAIPVGLGSAYSVYHANFSVETTCQTLRANIISMIDKKIDATARRMLVRHDVETFENTCVTVDPDAAAAFKTLLAEPAARVAAPVAKHIETPKAEVKAEPKIEPKAEAVKEVRKPDLRTAIPAEPAREPPKERAREAVREPAKETPKEAVKEPAKAAAVEAPARDAASDARWLDAVRGALVAHEKAANADAAADVAVSRGAPPHPLALPPPPVAAAPVTAAPALPPPTQVSEPVRAGAAIDAPADPDRPIPPAPIPEQSGPKPTGWVSRVPFVGQMLAK